jgi:hypothetical protein
MTGVIVLPHRHTTILCCSARIAPGVLPRRSPERICPGGVPRGIHRSRVRHSRRGTLSRNEIAQ